MPGVLELQVGKEELLVENRGYDWARVIDDMTSQEHSLIFPMVIRGSWGVSMLRPEILQKYLCACVDYNVHITSPGTFAA